MAREYFNLDEVEQPNVSALRDELPNRVGPAMLPCLLGPFIPSYYVVFN